MLPTIDLLNLSNDEQDISSVAKSLDQAFHQSGFAYIKNHGIDQQIVASAFDSSQKFHQLELSEGVNTPYEKVYKQKVYNEIINIQNEYV